MTLDPWASTLSEPGVSSLETAEMQMWLAFWGKNTGGGMDILMGTGEWGQGQAQGPHATWGCMSPLQTQGLRSFFSLKRMARQPQIHPVWIPAVLKNSNLFLKSLQSNFTYVRSFNCCKHPVR